MDEAVLGGPGGITAKIIGDGSGSSDAREKGHGRGRVVPALLVVLLIAALCPLVPGAQAGANEGGGSIERVPGSLGQIRLNNKGELAGIVFSGGTASVVIYKDGETTTLPGGPVSQGVQIADFDDQSEVLIRNNGQLEVHSAAGVRVLPQPVVGGGDPKAVGNGFGPTVSGEVLGIHDWEPTTQTNAVRYLGASPPQVLTAISTVFAMNSAGQVFGQLPGATKAYGVFDKGTVRSVDGLVGDKIYPMEWSDGGHLLYGADGLEQKYLWSDGASIPLTGGRPTNVNGKGMVSMVLPKDPGDPIPVERAGIRFADGEIKSVAELLGGIPAGWKTLQKSGQLNDRCDMLGAGLTENSEWVTFFAHIPNCEAPSFDGNFFRVDNGPSYVKKGESTPVRLRIANVSGSELTNVRLDSVEAAPDGSGGEAMVTQEGGGPPGTLTANGLTAQGFVDFSVAGVAAGKVVLTAEVSASKGGKAVKGTIESVFEVREDDLVVNLTLDPPDYEVPEDGVFEPTDITATVSFTNATDENMSMVKLTDLDVSRVFSGQELHVTYKSGIQPDPIDPEVIVPSLPAGATSPEFQAVFTATEDGEVEFNAMATAKVGEGGSATGVTKVRWKPKVKKFVEIKTTVANPTDDALLNAGGQVIINGTVENLTNNYDITLGPLYPTLKGNTGTMNVAYDGNAPNPTFPVPAEPMVLEHGETRTFQVRFTTNFSDPRMYEAQPSGGTRAYATFEPWGEAVEVRDPDDGVPERVEIRTYDEAKPGDGSRPGEDPDAQVLATPDDLFKRVSIDDSIEFEADRNNAAVAAGIMIGAVQGLGNAAIAAIYSIPDIVTMPFTILVAAYDYQAKVWASFTEEEKDLFLTESSFLIVSVLQRNVEFGLKDGKQLYDDVYKMAGDHLTQTQNDWETGDYLKTTQGYSAFLSETIGSVAGPVLLSKLAQSPKAVAALGRLQVALNARMASTFAAAKNLKYVDNVLPILQSIENGAEPTLTAIAKLWGVTPEEIAEYKRICGIIGCLASIRSRHASSVEWIKKWGALLKPENLKIKTVSELDVMLGYDIEDLGSLVFRKPDVLKTLGPGASKEQVAAEVRQFVASKGFKADTKEYLEAVTRMEDKVKEWNKYEKTYKQWNDRGWIDTTFNYEGNAIPEYRFDANGNIIGKLTGAEKGNFKGFRMVEKTPGSEEYVVQMLDGKTGKWRRVTGDIDPVDFTYTDGSPLSPEDHARLIQLLQDSPIGAEHGYTSTFLGFKDPKTGDIVVKPGPELVKAQFKPNEPALQIAPGDAAPRATRIDIENSRWVDAYDYNMRWVNGFVDAGTPRGRGSAQAVNANFDVIPLDAPKQVALPVKTKVPEPTVGRFIVKHANKGDSAALIMGENGLLQTVLSDGTTKDSPLHDQAFSEGPTETITVAPTTMLQNDPVPDPAPFNLFGFGGGTTPAKAVSGVTAISAVSRVAAETVRLSAASLDAGSDTIRVSNSPGLAAGATGFEVGQQLAIGTGGDHMELRKVAAVNDGVLTLTEPLEFTHEPGEVVVMVVSAAGVPVNPDKGVDPAPDPDPDTGGTGTNPDTSSGGGSGTDPGTGTSGGTTPAAPTPVSDTGSGSGTSGSSSATPSDSSGTASGGSSSSGGQPLAYTGTDTPRVIYLGSLLALIGLAFVAAGKRRRRSGVLTGHT